jgi:hypothetical protein
MMKKLLLVALSGIFIDVSAQIVEFVNPQNVFYGDVSNTSEVLHPGWEVTNVSGSDIYVGARMQILQMVSGADYQFCWGEICSPWLAENYLSTEEVFIANGESSNTFFSKYRHNGNSGQSIVNYCWFNVNQNFTDVCYEVNYCVNAECILNVSDAEPGATIDVISPNPVQNTGTISYSFASNPTSGLMTISNSMGAIVKEIALNSKKGMVIVGAAEFSDGLYFVNIEDQGRVFQTQRLMIQK